MVVDIGQQTVDIEFSKPVPSPTDDVQVLLSSCLLVLGVRGLMVLLILRDFIHQRGDIATTRRLIALRSFLWLARPDPHPSWFVTLSLHLPSRSSAGTRRRRRARSMGWQVRAGCKASKQPPLGLGGRAVRAGCSCQRRPAKRALRPVLSRQSECDYLGVVLFY